MEDLHYQFADLDWQERWNRSPTSAALSQSGPDVVATGFFGVVRFRLDQPADVAAIVNHARQFAAMVEEAGKRFFDAERELAAAIEERRHEVSGG